MSGRTFAIGDIHGDLAALLGLVQRLPKLTENDSLVLVGDYLDRGPRSAQVVDYIRNLPKQSPARIVALRGNHEDAWLRVIERGWPEFVMPVPNGCLAALRSFTGGPIPGEDEEAQGDELELLLSGKFFPPDVVSWMHELPYWHEDEHAIYVHAGLPSTPDGFVHPSKVRQKAALLWCRDEAFFRDYRGKMVVFGHTATVCLPPELSSYTPEDPTDIWAGPCTVGLDTGCGKGGFLTALELPGMRVYESR